MQRKTLLIQMKNKEDKKRNLNLEDPVDEITGEQIKEIGNLINSKNLFQSSPVTIERAYVRISTTEDISLA